MKLIIRGVDYTDKIKRFSVARKKEKWFHEDRYRMAHVSDNPEKYPAIKIQRNETIFDAVLFLPTINDFHFIRQSYDALVGDQMHAMKIEFGKVYWISDGSSEIRMMAYAPDFIDIT